MANTHLVLQGVKEYTRELLGTKQRDEAVAAAGRSEAGGVYSITERRGHEGLLRP